MQSQTLADKSSQSEQIVLFAVPYRAWPSAMLPVSPIGKFGFQNARGRGAENNADAMGAIGPFGLFDRLDESVLPQTQMRKPVVAASIVCKFGAELLIFDAVDATNPGFNRRRLEIVIAQPRTAGLQRAQCWV